MATYKVIQDIEAEDHILGPLSFRQFVFGLIAAFLGYMCFLVVVKHVAFLLVALLPPTLFCAFFAFPFGGDQPTETWALAKLRFWFLPRRRVWDQSGVKELVTITVPKKVEHVYTDGLSQGEVKSRLQALANTIDSRGWAIKHINAVGYMPQQTSSDRLIDIPNVPGEAPNDMAAPADDMLDANHNPVAQQFESMIAKSSQDRRERLMEELRKPLPPEPVAAGPEPQWFINHNPVASAVPAAVSAAPAATAQPVTAAPVPTAGADQGTDYADMVLGDQLKQQSQQSEAYGNLRTLRPLGTQTATTDDNVTPSVDDTAGPMTAGGDPAILSLSKNNDLNVATLAREAQRAKGDTQDEVVISLH
ncbi:MAG TPA: PrgI family protein [Candidatus Saccharimonadales bacterium]|nr:PrgI family protein [Candidatus Saccharimonadales bacterium]